MMTKLPLARYKPFIPLVAAICLLTTSARADYSPAGPFIYKLLQRQATVIAVSNLLGITREYLFPIQESLAAVAAAQWAGNSAQAKAALMHASTKLAELKAKHYLEGNMVPLSLARTNRDLGELAVAFYKYEGQLEKLLSRAQDVPAQIEKNIKENVAGEKLLSAARTFAGQDYGPGMQCSDLVTAAAHLSGVVIDNTAMPGKTVTGTWFARGMGPEFKQIIGGDNGITISQLIKALIDEKANVPFGSVIVEDGHAALFKGIINIQNQWHIITYDANAEKRSWTVSIDGAPTPGDPGPTTMLGFFPGHQVGEHVTRLQWGEGGLVKVFQPIGNYPCPTAVFRSVTSSPGQMPVGVGGCF